MNSDTKPGGRTSIPGDAPPGPDAPTIRVEVSDSQRHLRVEPETLARLVREVLTVEGIERASLSIALVDDATIHEINRRHLAHDWPTDVITFPLSEPGEALVAEIVVSAEMAAKTAAEVGADPHDELALYLVHGVLHLAGHDDQTEAEALAMRRREGEVLARLGRPNTFAAVGPVAAAGVGEESR